MQTRFACNKSCLLIYALRGTEQSNRFLLFQKNVVKKTMFCQKVSIDHKELIKKSRKGNSVVSSSKNRDTKCLVPKLALGVFFRSHGIQSETNTDE